MEKAEGSEHNPNIKQWKESVKKEQEKGKAPKDGTYPGSQRPAEPVATGFLEGVKISKIRGQFSGLGVKRWVVDDGLSQCRAILNGVRIGAAACYRRF